MEILVFLICDVELYGIFKAVFTVDEEKGMTLIELAENETVEDVIECTGCEFKVGFA